ncbi:MAG TPA: MFS transporter [Clostridia bacterium]|nr:MFS transporter [Clostridia bacterium]
MGNNKKKNSIALVIIVYLAGIFMGAIDTGIVTPARTIIQNNLSVDEKTGIWMITIYTLAYAASIPVMGKLADRYGRKLIYITSIFLFGFGSLLCGLSHYTGSFGMLIAARAVQAIGGGGIMPVATAEFGTSFPQEKRGMALGLVGGVYGIANIFGSLAGSAILDIFGSNNWQYIFFVNLPISLFIIIAGIIVLPNNKEINLKRIDGFGIVIIVSMVLSLLYGLKNIDFFDFKNTITSTDVYPFLIAFIVLLPLFLLAEKKAQDPIINLKYFSSGKILITLAVSFAAGFVLMGIVFIPQFSENALKITSGNGGYFTVILGLLSGVSAMLSGKMIDKFGAKLVLFLGFTITIIGALFLIMVTAVNPGLPSVVASLMLLGFGLGFTMGAPVNYMMLDNISENEANSGLATLSLVRSIGTSIAPALMVGFIAHAGLSLQTDIKSVLPNEITVPELPYVQDITNKVNELKSDPNMSQKLGSVDIPDLNSMQTFKLDFSGNDSDFTVPDNILKELQTSDVTTITTVTKDFASTMFDQKTPKVISDIQSGLNSGIDGIASGMSELDKNLSGLQSGYDGIGKGIEGMQIAVKQQETAFKQLQSIAVMIPPALSSSSSFPNGMSLADLLPLPAKSSIPKNVLEEITAIKSMSELRAKTVELQGAIDKLNTQIEKNKQSQAGMKTGIDQMTKAKNDMQTLLNEMNTLNNAIPGAFKTSEKNYLNEIDARSNLLQDVYQKTLNTGYKSIYLTVAISSALAILLLVFYRKKIAAIAVEPNQ